MLSLTTLEKKTKFISNNHTLIPTVLIKLLRPGIARLVFDNDKVLVYHCCDNDRTVTHVPDNDNTSSFTPLEFEIDDAPAIEQILTSTDEYIAIKDLTHESSSDNIQEKIEIVSALMKEEILDIKNVGLGHDDDDNDDDEEENDEQMQEDEDDDEEVGF